MPRSGGGGSHSSGSHSSGSSGGYSSSGSSGSSSYGNSSSDNYVPSYKTSYYSGATRYAYYDAAGHVRDYYGTRRVEKPKKSTFVSIIVFYALVILLGIGLCSCSIYVPEPICPDPAPSTVVDNGGFLTDKTGLQKELQTFTDQTGITVCFTAITNEAWQPYFEDMEVCAYEYYINTFADEDSLLILYSQPETVDPAFNDWHFEIMYGDNTVSLLTDSKITDLRENLQKGFMLKGNTPEAAVTGAITAISTGIMDRQFLWGFLIIGLPFAALGVILLIAHVRKYRKKSKESTAVKVGRNASEEICEYCGLHYLVGMGTTCRGCGAPLKLTAGKNA